MFALKGIQIGRTEAALLHMKSSSKIGRQELHGDHMADLRQDKNLALKIGMYHIALVVNAVFNKMKTQPALATLFDVNESHSGEEACLTYFWWLVLGGNKLSDLDSDVIRRCERMGISPSLFREWLALFRQSAPPIIGKELTDAWMRRALQVADEFPVTGDAVQSAQRS